MGCGSSRAGEGGRQGGEAGGRRKGRGAGRSGSAGGGGAGERGSGSSSGSTSAASSVALTAREEKTRLSAIRARGNDASGGRRGSVYSESIVPSSERGGRRKRVVHAKPKASAKAIADVLSASILFRDLRDDLLDEVVDAMFEKTVAKGTELISQGDSGDFFYILGSGVVEVFVSGTLVQTVEAGGSFGELALLYNAPRAATCRTATKCVVWGLDRMTFKRVLVDSDDQRRRLYVQLLQRIPLFAEMTPRELRHVADVVQPRTHAAGDIIIRQGDKGKRFFILESGSAAVRMVKGDGPEIELARIGSGDYFGEIALVNRQRRAATIVALEKCYTVSLDRASFQRLLGPLEDVLKRNMDAYVTYENILKNGLNDKARHTLYARGDDSDSDSDSDS